MSTSAFDPRHAAQLRVAQAVAVVRQLPVTAGTFVGGMAIALTMQLQEGFGWAALAWQLAMGSLAAATLLRWRRLRDRPPPQSVSSAHIRKIVAFAACYGVLSAIGIVHWAGAAGPNVATWVLGIMLSLPAYCAAAYYFVPGVVTAFSAPLFAGCLFFMAFRWGGGGGELGIVLVAIHIVVTAFFVRRNWEHFAIMVMLDAQKSQLAEALRSQAEELREAQSRVVAEARRAGMAQIATNVLHNVGNVLTSVNVSAHVLSDRVRQSRSARVADIAGLLEGLATPPAGEPAQAGKAEMLPGYVRALAGALDAERDELLAELARLGASVDHIKNVVAMQQSYAGASGVIEVTSLTEVADDALSMQSDALQQLGVEVRRDYGPVPPAAIDRTRVMQVLVNLLENACEAMRAAVGERRLSLAVGGDADGMFVAVRDSGCGIALENLQRIFQHGFTTREDGHGFGLHSCAMAAREMGGTLAAHSDGPGRGATFTLRLPAAQAASAPPPPTRPSASRSGGSSAPRTTAPSSP